MVEPQILRVRRAPLPADAVIVVRGDDLDPATARRQALVFRRRYPDWGRWGLSAFYPRNDAEIDDLAADRLDRFPELSLFRVVDLEAAGFSVVATFRTPHVTIAFDGDLDTGLATLAGTSGRPRRRRHGRHRARPTVAWPCRRERASLP